FDEFTVQTFMSFAEAPRFALSRIAGRVGTHKRRKYAELYPSGEQLRVRLPAEASNIRSAKRHAGCRQPLKLKRAQTKMLPGSYVIARPNRGVTLCAGISGPCNRKRTFFLEQILQPLISGSYHLHPVHIVGLSVRSPVAVVIMADIVRKGTPAKYRRLV